MNISTAIEVLSSAISDPRKGLPEDVFLFISRLTPMVNVDLLIQDERKRTLLTWRDDELLGPGWHIPGGIIRYKEDMALRVQAVASIELGTEVDFDPDPIAINQIIVPEKKERAHFVSLLFRCFLRAGPDEKLRFQSGHPKAGEWAWLARFPENMIRMHHIYRRFFQG